VFGILLLFISSWVGWSTNVTDTEAVGERPGLPWAESFSNSWRDHITSTSKQNGQGYLKAFLISWLKMLTLFNSLS